MLLITLLNVKNNIVFKILLSRNVWENIIFKIIAEYAIQYNNVCYHLSLH